MRGAPPVLERLLGRSPLVRVLFWAALALCALVAAITLTAVAIGLPRLPADEGKVSWPRGETAVGGETAENDGLASFEGIGNLRVKSADREPALLSVTIVLGVPPGDRAFREELISKTPRLKAACAGVLGSMSAAELSPGFEGAIKARLRDEMNVSLTLGKIGAVYLPVYQLIE